VNRRTICRALALLPAAAALPAAAQPAPMFRVAWVSSDRAGSNSPSLEAFRAGMRELGYVEGRNFAIDTWWGEGSPERLEKAMGDILRAGPDVIVAQGGQALRPVLKAGVKLPVVFGMSADPVEAKVVASFARPGGNVTGMSFFALDLVGKRMELIKEVLPGIKRIAVVANPEHPGEQKELAVSQAAADKLGLALHYFPVRTGAELEAALASIAKARDGAILAFADAFTLSYADRFAEFARRERIPAIAGWAAFARRGNLMTYGPVIDDSYRRMAAYVDRLHKGAKPSDLPIEFPTKVELVVNVVAAKAVGITIPPNVLARADEVIR
jgi:putative ABC transport system substrate-binding protein